MFGSFARTRTCVNKHELPRDHEQTNKQTNRPYYLTYRYNCTIVLLTCRYLVCTSLPFLSDLLSAAFGCCDACSDAWPSTQTSKGAVTADRSHHTLLRDTDNRLSKCSAVCRDFFETNACFFKSRHNFLSDIQTAFKELAFSTSHTYIHTWPCCSAKQH